MEEAKDEALSRSRDCRCGNESIIPNPALLDESVAEVAATGVLARYENLTLVSRGPTGDILIQHRSTGICLAGTDYPGFCTKVFVALRDIWTVSREGLDIAVRLDWLTVSMPAEEFILFAATVHEALYNLQSKPKSANRLATLT